MDHKRNARAWIPNVHGIRSGLCLDASNRLDIEFDLRKRVEAGEVGEVLLGGVDGVLFVLPVHGVELGGEPVEIVADWIAGGVVQLKFQEVGSGEIWRRGKIEGFGGGVGRKIDGGVAKGGLLGVNVDEW